jgi:hypothetical protein
MKASMFAIVGVGLKPISVAHQSTVPVRPLPLVAVMIEVVLVSGFVGEGEDNDPGLGTVVVSISVGPPDS